MTYQEIAQFSKTLMLKEPFYGLFLISLNKELNNSIPTACVSPNGLNIKLSINPEFWESLDKNTKLGVLKHELLHIVFFHLENWDKYPNKRLLNVATDLEVNQYINEEYKGENWEGLEYNKGIFKPLNLLPKQGTKYYYETLEKDAKNNPGKCIDELIKEYDEHQLWEEIKDLGEAERKLIKKQIDHNLKEIASSVIKSRGTIPSELENYIGELFTITEPVMDWKSYLRRFSSKSNKVYTKKTRYKPSKRFSGNPALKIIPQKSTLVAIDTSGSVSDKELVEFFNEIYHIYKTGVSVTVIECDMNIQRIYEYKGELKDLKVKGRGGTSFEPVIDYLIENKKKYNNLIYLTDGEAPPPKKVLTPILWVHSSTSSINEDLPGSKIKIQ